MRCLVQKNKGISFESITRARRKVQRKYPNLKDTDTAEFREAEQENYVEYALDHHVPRLD